MVVVVQEALTEVSCSKTSRSRYGIL